MPAHSFHYNFFTYYNLLYFNIRYWLNIEFRIMAFYTFTICPLDCSVWSCFLTIYWFLLDCFSIISFQRFCVNSLFLPIFWSSLIPIWLMNLEFFMHFKFFVQELCVTLCFVLGNLIFVVVRYICFLYSYYRELWTSEVN